MKRVVIDTNVLVSALLFGGIPGKLIPLWKSGIIEPVASRAIFAEYLRLLAYPRFELPEQEIDHLVAAELLPWMDIIEVPPGEPVVADDPADDKFVWCALAAGADAIISGDEHLLELDLPQVPIFTPGQFLKRLKT